jgi:hypothetical protein
VDSNGCGFSGPCLTPAQRPFKRSGFATPPLAMTITL